MFNVTVLKMRDIVKCFIGIIITLFLIICITKYFNKNTNEEQVVQGIKNNLRTLSQSNMIQCIDSTIPSMSTINNEYKNISNEDDKIKENVLLEEVLKTQISSIRGLEKIEEKEQDKEKIETAKKEENQEKQDNSENIQLARNRTYHRGNYKQSY